MIHPAVNTRVLRSQAERGWLCVRALGLAGGGRGCSSIPRPARYSPRTHHQPLPRIHTSRVQEAELRIAGARNVEVEVGRRRGECPASAATPMASPQLPPSTVAERTRPRIPPWNTWRRWGGGRGAQASPGVEQNQAEGMAGMRLRGATQVQAEATCQAVPLRTPAPCRACSPVGSSTEGEG